MIEQIPAKTILTPVKDGSSWFGVDYNMNLYKGCCHGCIYCDSRSSCYQIEDFDRVRTKANALSILERELRTRKKTGVVGMGSMSDTYNPFEKKLELTRGALHLMHKYGFGVSIETKSALITRDADILSRIAADNDAIVKITITAADDDLCKKIEPHVSPSSERFSALETLCGRGIFAGILLTPVLPYITDTEENIVSIVRRASRCGVKFISTYGMGVTLRDNQRAHYYAKLDELFPGLSGRYTKIYGDTYSCRSENASRLLAVFANECEKHGITYRMDDIIRAYKIKNIMPEQLSLF